MSTTKPYDWVRTLSPELKALDVQPLWGYPPQFPFDKLGQILSQFLRIPNAQVEVVDVQWRDNPSFGANTLWLNYAVPPLPQQVSILMNPADLDKIIQQQLPADLQEGFKRFLALELATVFNKVDYDRSLSPQFLHFDSVDGPALCVDLQVANITARIALPPEFMQGLRERYAQRNTDLPSFITERMHVIAHLVAGRTEITRNVWNEIQPGDFLILDHCTLTPGEDKGRVMIEVNGHPIFRAKIKDGNVKILEYPLYHEVPTPMAKDYDDEIEESEFENDSFLDDETDDEDFLDEEQETEQQERAAAEEEEDEEEDSIAPVSKSDVPAAPLLKPEELPVAIVVEVGRLQLTIQKLMDLQPGNVLELDVHPENGVDLTVNGKCIGKGELLKIGETLGVRILEKG